MKSLFKQALVVASLALLNVGAHANPALAKKKGCASCHGGVAGVNVRVPVAGMPQAPSFYDLYSKFNGQQEAEAKMMAVWMGNAKHPKMSVNSSERKALVKFYLSTDPVETSGQRQTPSRGSE
jgi:cytochrome c551/c552